MSWLLRQKVFVWFARGLCLPDCPQLNLSTPTLWLYSAQVSTEYSLIIILPCWLHRTAEQSYTDGDYRAKARQFRNLQSHPTSNARRGLLRILRCYEASMQ